MKNIETKKGLETLLERYRKAGASQEHILTVEGCIKEGLAMDEIDWENTPAELRKLWRGLE